MNETEAGVGAPPARTRLAGVERATILMAAIPASMIFTTMMPILAKMERDLAPNPDDAVLVRIALNIVGLSMMIGSLAAGAIIDRFGVRRLIFLSTVIWLVAGVGSYFVADVWTLIFCRFAEGLAAAALIVAGASMLGILSSEVARGQLGGLQIMVATLVGLATLVLAGFLGDLDWRYTFFLNLLALPLLLVSLRLSHFEATPRPAVSGERLLDHFPVMLSFFALMAGTVTFAITTYMPYRFSEIGVESSSLIGMALSAQAVTVAISSACYSRFRRYVSARGCFTFSFLTIGVASVLAGLATHYWMAIGALLIVGLGVGPIVPNLFALASAEPPGRRGKVIGVVKSFHYAAALLGALAFEPVMRLGGTMGTLIVVGFIAFAVSAVSWFGAIR